LIADSLARFACVGASRAPQNDAVPDRADS